MLFILVFACANQNFTLSLHQKSKTITRRASCQNKSEGHQQGTMKKIQFNEVKSYEDIENAIKNALQYDEVVADDAAAEKWFKDAEIEGEVTHRVIVSTEVSFWNEEMQGEEFYSVIVKEHFTDPGSVDYVYSYSIC